MRYLKTYKLFEAAKTGLTKRQEEFLNRWTSGSWTYDPATGLVDVKGDFDYHGKKAKTLSGIKFGKVSGSFSCSSNNLTSLEGAPQEVGGDFRCLNNNLTSLEGAPQEVGGDFHCSSNNFTSLEGAPQEVGGNFSCYQNKLTSLVGAPQKVGGYFDCSENNLTTLEGVPKEVVGFDCSNNNLTSLKGAPQEVARWSVSGFNCSNNKLTSLEGAPQKVGGSFNCLGNDLTSLEGAPQEVDGSFDCRGNKLTSLKGAPQKVEGSFECDAFELDQFSNWDKGIPRNPPFSTWSLKNWIGLLKEGSPEAQKLIATFLAPEVLNKEIQQDPAGMIMKLKAVWNDESFKETRDKLVWPKGFGDQAKLVGDLDDIGF